MKNIRKIAYYNIEWQIIRMEMRTFNSLENCIANRTVLEKYVADSLNETQQIIRLWRVINLLNATRMGFHGCGYVGSSMDAELVSFRDTLQKMLTDLQSHLNVTLADVLSDNQINSSMLVQLKKDKPVFYQLLLDDLRKRYSNGTAETRPQLLEFIEMMD
jgi:signal transduction histidine kinase